MHFQQVDLGGVVTHLHAFVAHLELEYRVHELGFVVGFFAVDDSMVFLALGEFLACSVVFVGGLGVSVRLVAYSHGLLLGLAAGALLSFVVAGSFNQFELEHVFLWIFRRWRLQTVGHANLFIHCTVVEFAARFSPPLDFGFVAGLVRRVTGSIEFHSFCVLQGFGLDVTELEPVLEFILYDCQFHGVTHFLGFLGLLGRFFVLGLVLAFAGLFLRVFFVLVLFWGNRFLSVHIVFVSGQGQVVLRVELLTALAVVGISKVEFSFGVVRTHGAAQLEGDVLRAHKELFFVLHGLHVVGDFAIHVAVFNEVSSFVEGLQVCQSVALTFGDVSSPNLEFAFAHELVDAQSAA
mmetsp:Transcript_95332/g.205691  ORF Transcript_95332/g.205691 Transcript_95332/m.205691 type:complete len:350 (-) Transcript_95332:1997-3046(-)